MAWRAKEFSSLCSGSAPWPSPTKRRSLIYVCGSTPPAPLTSPSYGIQAWFEHDLDGTDTNRYSLPNPLYRFLKPHNIWVHYEHNKYPGIPLYNLAKARAMEVAPNIFTIPEMWAGLGRASFYQPKDQAEKTKETA